MGLIGSDVNMHFMDHTEHLPISPIYHVIWYNWCTMLWRCTGRAQLQIRVEIHRYSSAGILSLHYVGSNCTTLSFSYRNTNLYLFMLKYPAVGNEAWDTTHNWYEVSWQTPGNVECGNSSPSRCFHPPHWKEDLTITAVRNPEARALLGPNSSQVKSKDKLKIKNK